MTPSTSQRSSEAPSRKSDYLVERPWKEEVIKGPESSGLSWEVYYRWDDTGEIDTLIVSEASSGIEAATKARASLSRLFTLSYRIIGAYRRTV